MSYASQVNDILTHVAVYIKPVELQTVERISAPPNPASSPRYYPNQTYERDKLLPKRVSIYSVSPSVCINSDDLNPFGIEDDVREFWVLAERYFVETDYPTPETERWMAMARLWSGGAL